MTFILALIFILLPDQNVFAQCGSIRFNEIDYDQSGTDELEFIELSGNPGDDLSGFELHLVNGLNSTVYRSESLSGELPSDGFFVLGSSNVTNVDQFIGSGGANLILNGAPDGAGLWDTETETYCDFINYEGTVAGFESWPMAGTDPAGICATGAGDSLAFREGSPGDSWVEGACSTPGAPNLGPTAVKVSSLTARSRSSRSSTLDLRLFAFVLALIKIFGLQRSK